MKKIYLLLMVVCPFFGFSQQMLKRITETNSQITIEFFALRNGTSPCEITGPDFFDAGVLSLGFGYYNTSGEVIEVYSHNPDDGILSTSFQPVQINNTTFNFVSQDQYSRGLVSTNVGTVVYEGETLVSYTPILQIVTEGYYGIATSGDSYFTNLHYSKYILKKQLSNGSPIPIDTWVSFQASEGIYIVAGQQINVRGQYWAKFNGTTWIEQTRNCFDEAVTPIEDICTTMGTPEIAATKDGIFATPNPFHDNVILNKPIDNNGHFEYVIMDITGKTISNGNSDFGNNINIASLTQGYYFIAVTDDLGKSTYLKIIKK